MPDCFVHVMNASGLDRPAARFGVPVAMLMGADGALAPRSAPAVSRGGDTFAAPVSEGWSLARWNQSGRAVTNQPFSPQQASTMTRAAPPSSVRSDHSRLDP